MREGWVKTTLGAVALLNPPEPPLRDTDHFVPMDAVHTGKRWIEYTEENRDRKGARARQGDVLFARITPCLENGKVAQVQSEIERCGGSTEFIVIRGTEKCLSDFLYFWCTLNSNRQKAAKLMTGTTGRQRLSRQDLANLDFFLPPLSEQKRIVDLITSVDSYIGALQQQLESAKISRNAVLHELLTAGGDDWEITTLGAVALLNPPEPPLMGTDHFVPMDAVHVGKRWVQYTEERRDRNGARARAGDVLFARITPCLENGKIAQIQSELERCGGSTEFIVVRGTEKCRSDFLYFWCTLKLNRDKAAELMTGTTGRQRLSWQSLGSLSLWLPSIKEQESIVSNISEFDNLIESTESAITETQNLRSGLLSDLLSGIHEIPASYDKVLGAA